jgi:Flp pilus assembly protein TadB
VTAPGAVLAVVLAAGAAALLVPGDSRDRLEVVLGRARSGPARAGAGGASRERPDPAPRTSTQVLASATGGVGLALVVGGAAGLLLGTVGGALALVLLRRLEPRSARERRERLAADLPTAIDLLAACLAAGRPPAPALAAVAGAVGDPLAAELGTVGVRLDLGAEPVGVWSDVAAGPGPLAALGRTMARSLETGAPMADGLGLLAADLRRRRRAATEQRARSVGVCAAAPLGLCFLPAFVLVGVVPAVVSAFSAMSWW